MLSGGLPPGDSGAADDTVTCSLQIQLVRIM